MLKAGGGGAVLMTGRRPKQGMVPNGVFEYAPQDGSGAERVS
jgi:hypothetical protein